MNDGDVIDVWPDSSGHGHDGARVGTPIFKTNIVGDKPVVRLSSATHDGFNLALNISDATPFTIFVVMKAVSPTVALYSLAGNFSGAVSGWPLGPLQNIDGFVYIADRLGYKRSDTTDRTTFHVLVGNSDASGGGVIRQDGVSIGLTGSAVANTGDFSSIGYNSVTPAYSDGDIAEIVFFNQILIPVYTQNVEKTLSVKYGTPAPPAGSVVDISIVPGLFGWWKADSLLTAIVTPVGSTTEIELFDPANVPSLVEVGKVINIELFDVLGGVGGGSSAAPETLDIQAAENIPAFSFITVTGFVANSNNVAHYGKVIGIVQLATSTGFIASAVDEGEITNPAWSWTPGQKLFLNGMIISSSPVGVFSQMIGVAKNATTIIVRLEPPILL